MEMLGWCLPGHCLLSGQGSAALARSLRVGAEGVTSPMDALSQACPYDAFMQIIKGSPSRQAPPEAYGPAHPLAQQPTLCGSPGV